MTLKKGDFIWPKYIKGPMPWWRAVIEKIFENGFLLISQRSLYGEWSVQVDIPDGYVKIGDEKNPPLDTFRTDRQIRDALEASSVPPQISVR